MEGEACEVRAFESSEEFVVGGYHHRVRIFGEREEECVVYDDAGVGGDLTRPRHEVFGRE